MKDMSALNSKFCEEMLVWILLTVVNGFSFYENFHAPRLPDLNTTWCKVFLNQDHRGWSTWQPPEEWTNITVGIYSNSFQMTGAVNNKMTGNLKARPMGFSVDFVNGYVTVYCNYWSQNLSLYWAFYSPGVSPDCNVTVIYGHRL